MTIFYEILYVAIVNLIGILAAPRKMKMTNNEIYGLLGTSFLLSAGQALFKKSALSVKKEPTISFDVFTLFLVPSFWIAIFLYGTATLLWIYLLQTVPLSRAYPFAALGFVIVPCLAVILFGEKLSAYYLIGAMFVMIGVTITSRA